MKNMHEDSYYTLMLRLCILISFHVYRSYLKLIYLRTVHVKLTNKTCATNHWHKAYNYNLYIKILFLK